MVELVSVAGSALLITETDAVVHVLRFVGFRVLKHEGVDHQREVPGRHRRREAGLALPAQSSTEVSTTG